MTVAINGSPLVDVPKLDDQQVLGLSGIYGSLAYKVNEIETHDHSAGRFFGNSGTPNATALITSIIPWVVSDIGGAYGTAIQILLGDEDFDLPFTPVYFDPHRLIIANASADGVYSFRLANSGWNGTTHTYTSMAEAIAAKVYSMGEFIIADNKKPEGSIPIQTGLARVGSKIWIDIKSSVSGATADIRLGVHTYKG
jgi:hypothetical protein